MKQKRGVELGVGGKGRNRENVGPLDNKKREKVKEEEGKKGERNLQHHDSEGEGG